MKIIACHSNKGGVGKTATAVNLAYALAAAGRRTLLCDLDPQGAATFYFRVQPSRKLTEERFWSARRLSEAIRGSDFDGLDILPANLAYRNFDAFLAHYGKSRSRLRKILPAAVGDYDAVVLDCPPSLSALAENVFRAADVVVVPVIPSTLSQRTFEQLLAFLRERDEATERVLGFFSMVQAGKLLHRQVMSEMRATHGAQLLASTIPAAADIERMGVHRAPVLASRPGSPSAHHYEALLTELQSRMEL